MKVLVFHGANHYMLVLLLLIILLVDCRMVVDLKKMINGLNLIQIFLLIMLVHIKNMPNGQCQYIHLIDHYKDRLKHLIYLMIEQLRMILQLQCIIGIKCQLKNVKNVEWQVMNGLMEMNLICQLNECQKDL